MNDLMSRPGKRTEERTETVGTDREKYSWGLRLIEANIEDIKGLPSVTPKRKAMICGACSHSDSEVLYLTNPPRIQCRKTGNLHFTTDICDCENMNNQHEISRSDEDAERREDG